MSTLPERIIWMNGLPRSGTSALLNLLAWVAEDREPPPSVYPRTADGTAVSRAAALPVEALADASHSAHAQLE